MDFQVKLVDFFSLFKADKSDSEGRGSGEMKKKRKKSESGGRDIFLKVYIYQIKENSS